MEKCGICGHDKGLVYRNNKICEECQFPHFENALDYFITPEERKYENRKINS